MKFLKLLVFRLVLVLLALLFSLAVLEVFMRLGKPKTLKDLESTWDRSPRLFFNVRPNPWVKGARDPLRVAVVGDSFANGQGVQADDSFGLRLERLLNLNEGVRPAEVRIWAKGGLTTDEEMAYLEDVVAWKPHVVILQFFLNDTEDNRRRAELMEWRADMMPKLPSPWLAWFLKRSRAGEWLYMRAETVRMNRGFREYYRKLYDRNYSGWKKFEYAIHEFQDTCAKANASLVVVIFPIISHVDHYRFDAIHEQVHQALEKEKVRYIDLLDELRGKMPVRLEVVPKVDSHPNEIAHRIASETIFNYLLNEELIADEYVPQAKDVGRFRYWRQMAGHMFNPLEEAPLGPAE